MVRFSEFESLLPATNVKIVSKRRSLRPQRSCCKAHSRFQPSRTCQSPTGVKAALAGAGSLSIDTWHICMQGYFLFRVSSSTSGFSGSKRSFFVRAVLYDNGLKAMQHLRISFSAKSSLLTRSPAMARRKADFLRDWFYKERSGHGQELLLNTTSLSLRECGGTQAQHTRS